MSRAENPKLSNNTLRRDDTLAEIFDSSEEPSPALRLFVAQDVLYYNPSVADLTPARALCIYHEVVFSPDSTAL
ncbi:hypothetical protein ACJQWK_06853 [Exserohilum turcicum]|uniref:Uncharacterized protein n=1 Tax=Exserohilum turcicum (strain 28A) TaxID=671987 RepID=R0IJ92_EXST2|nr:uncharacterized protein SETTUDRAFT_163909 [Exserohilum turcica Et28A]EOA85220.1 hypothetical protein SETTUDRAFT_163909 [Exserohilum turcica Et28A]